MFFTRTHSYQTSLGKDDLRNKLIGRHVNIHNLDFEVIETEDDAAIRIIPHAEQVEDIKTLPITKLILREKDGKTSVVMTSKMRQLDLGGPLLIMSFCGFFAITSVVLYFCKEMHLSVSLFASDVLLFAIFWFRMERGYFDYVRKVRRYVKSLDKQMR